MLHITVIPRLRDRLEIDASRSDGSFSCQLHLVFATIAAHRGGNRASLIQKLPRQPFAAQFPNGL
jgi:hypothetical protein